MVRKMFGGGLEVGAANHHPLPPGLSHCLNFGFPCWLFLCIFLNFSDLGANCPSEDDKHSGLSEGILRQFQSQVITTPDHNQHPEIFQTEEEYCKKMREAAKKRSNWF